MFSKSNEIELATVAGAVLVSAIAGSYATGASLIDVATSFDGALGAAAGIVVVPMVFDKLKMGGEFSKLGKYPIQFLSAALIPGLIGMRVDMPLLAVAGGAVVGFDLASKFIAEKYPSGGK